MRPLTPISTNPRWSDDAPSADLGFCLLKALAWLAIVVGSAIMCMVQI